MPKLSPNRLRFVQCELPSDVLDVFTALLDEFQVTVQEIDAEVDNFNANIKPEILAELDAQIPVREALLDGSLVPELSSLAAMEESLKLVSPAKGDDDQTAVRLDERKLGAAGIVCLNGKLFAKADGTDFDPFRRLWLSCKGDYDSFIAFGDGIAAAQDGEFTLVQSTVKDDLQPYVNRTFQELNNISPNIKLSYYNQDLIWKNTVTPSNANYTKLRKIGYSSQRIEQIFARTSPSLAGYTTLLSSVTANLKDFSALMLLPPTSPDRQPRWNNEVKFLAQAFKDYILYRTENNLTSSVFNVDLWERVKSVLTPKDMKELFEERPEIRNMKVPTDEVELGELINKASSIPSESSIINSYMIKLPPSPLDTTFETSLVNTGLKFYTKLFLANHPATAQIKSLVEEIAGRPIGAGEAVPQVNFNIKEIKDVLDIADGESDQSSSQLVGSLNQNVINSEDPALVQQSLNSSLEGDKINNQKNSTTKITQGLKTVENFSSILFRRVRWKENFIVCNKVTTTEVEGFEETESVTNLPSNVTGDVVTAGQSDRVKAGNAQSLRAKDRRTIAPAQPVKRRKIEKKFSYECAPKFEILIGGLLGELSQKYKKLFLELIRSLKIQIFAIQEMLDNLILKVQVALDSILARLERLLTFDFNIGGKFGFENSLIKCSWDINFGLKIDLFGVLLTLLNSLIKNISKFLRDLLKPIQDLITKVICIPVRIIEAFLGGVNALLGLFGCSLKDIRLPAELLDFLKALLFSFDLRALVLRKGYDAVLGMTLGLNKHRESFRGLTQFAAICQNVTMRDALNTFDSLLLHSIVAAPTNATDKLKASSSVLKEKAVSTTFGLI